MPLTPDQLPDDITELKQRLIVKDAELLARSSELAIKVSELVAAKNGLIVTQLTIEKLKAQIAKLRREKFGSSSERIERVISQLELALEEAETAKAEAEASAPQQPEPPPVPAGSAPAESEPATKKKRRQLPPELPRRNVVHMPPGVCKTCGGADQRTVGESVTEVLAYIPARFEVIRHVRPACSCRKCETMVQAPMPELPIPRGMVDASFLAHIAIAKFCDHLPLYRQVEIYARSGLDLDRGQLAAWLGHVAWLLRPLVELIAAHVMAGRVIHADDTPVPVLAPGAGKTKTGRQWVYLRDERPHAGPAPPAVLYRYTPDRKGEHAQAELARFVGWLHADGYAGFGRLYEIATGRSAEAALLQGPPRVAEVGCWSHVRRGFFDEYASHKSAIAKEALDRIGALFDIERVIAGKPPEIRRSVRQRTARPKINELATWLDAQLKLIPGKSDLARAIRYARSRWDALCRYLDDGRLEISNNAAENQIRPVALGRKNWLFSGSDAGGERAAAFYTLIRTARLNGIEPEAYLCDVIARIGSYPINRLAELLPWNWSPPATQSVAA
ncbi:MAG: IS66 family transposase [Burkholderiales bacterium]